MSKRSWYNIIGLGLFGLGTLSILLNLVGLDFGFMKLLDALGPLGAFLVKLLLIFGGLVTFVLGNEGDEEAYDEFFDGPRNKPKRSKFSPPAEPKQEGSGD